MDFISTPIHSHVCIREPFLMPKRHRPGMGPLGLMDLDEMRKLADKVQKCKMGPLFFDRMNFIRGQS